MIQQWSGVIRKTIKQSKPLYFHAAKDALAKRLSKPIQKSEFKNLFYISLNDFLWIALDLA